MQFQLFLGLVRLARRVTDDYPPVRNAFSGTIDRVRIDLGPAIRLDPPDETRISIARND